ncbi:MAG TPA: hypothetical protein VN894_08480, partial [Polyangiaceae bacterium]|nr:hypothetical protein [Polyangiaceae bacterium]
MLHALGPTWIATAAVFAALLAAIVPTCLYRYVEPRSRLNWGRAGDSPRSRRAPALVRITAWLSFAVGQMAVLWVLVPTACAFLIYLQARLGFGRPLGVAATAAAGTMALSQSAMAIRLLPLGVRLLACDKRLPQRIERIAKWNGLMSAALLSLGMLVGWGMAASPSLVHPWLRVALEW